jgi:Na+/proline symporter
VCPGIFPTAFTLLWRGQTKLAAITSAFLGMNAGLAVWLSTAYALEGELSVASTGQILPCLYGTVTSAFLPLPVSIILSFVKASVRIALASVNRDLYPIFLLLAALLRLV